MKNNRGFTLIELLVVIAVIGLLASVVMVALNSARIKARDARRLADVRQVLNALALYLDANGQYPDSDFQGCGGWDTPGDGDFISALRTAGYLSADIKDPLPGEDSSCSNYRYYRYDPGYEGCDTARGAFFVLQIYNLETSNGPHPASPGWKCPLRDWQSGVEWVTGGFEK